MKKFNKVIIFLNVILVVLIGYILLQSHNKIKANEAIQVNVNNKVEDWQMKANILNDELHKENKLITLQGSRKVKYVFDYTKDEIKYSGKSNQVKFLAAKLNQLKTKEISVTTSFNYTFSYDLKTLNAEVKGDKIYITLQRGNINLEPLAEDSKSRVIESETRILSGSFTPQETSAVMNMVMIHTMNNLSNDNDLYNQALENAKENIQELSSKLGIDVEIDVISQDAIPNNEVEVIEKP